MNITVKKFIIESLEKVGVDYVFGMPGYQTLKLYDGFVDSKIKNILITNELFASFMATGYSWATGKIGVCISISGPGFTNMFTGLANALLDSVSILVIVVGVKLKEKSFQTHQIEQAKAVKPIVKNVFSIKTVDEVLDVIPRAFDLAQKGDPGPVVIEVPEDLLDKTIETEGVKCQKNVIKKRLNKDKIKKIIEIIKSSKLCGIYAGKGAFNASEDILKLAEIISAPIATTISGKGVVSEEHPLSVGVGFGVSGTKISENIFKKCDTVLAIGCKFSEMATGGWSLKMPENLIHIDINEDVLGRNYPTKVSLCSDAKLAIKAILNHADIIKKNNNTELIREIRAERKSHLEEIKKIQNKNFVHPAKLLYILREVMKKDAILTTDCGYHQLWSITDFPVLEKRTFITTSDYQSMGFGIPAAIGAKIAYPNRDVVCICGDGGFLISGFELLTTVREKLKIIVIIFNDGALGLIKHLQQLSYGRTYSVDLHNPDFETLAESLDIGYVEILGDDNIEYGIKKAFASDKTVIVDARIKYKEEPRYLQGTRKTFWSRLSAEEKFRLTAKIVKMRKKQCSRKIN